jgi:hypothetical protein
MDGGHAETCAAPGSDIHMQICSGNASRWGPLSIRLFTSKRGGMKRPAQAASARKRRMICAEVFGQQSRFVRSALDGIHTSGILASL